jgi:hypothetical protein
MAFIFLVKTASESVRRSQKQLNAQLTHNVMENSPNCRVTVLLRRVPDDDNPCAMLNAQDEGCDELIEIMLDADFKLNRQTAQTWVNAEFAKPGSGRR